MYKRQIRHQALAQLNKLPSTHDVWHLEALIRTAELCIKFEEGFCEMDSPMCRDIPEWHRIHSTGFDGWDLEGPRQRCIAHLRLRPNGMDGEWFDISEIIEW